MKPKTETRWNLGRRAMVGVLWWACICATLLVLSVATADSAPDVAGSMFASLCALIAATLVTLVGGKAVQNFQALKYEPEPRRQSSAATDELPTE